MSIEKKRKQSDLKSCWMRFLTFIVLSAGIYFSIGFLVHGVWLGVSLFLLVVVLFTASQYFFMLFAKRFKRYRRLSLKENSGLRNLYFELLYEYPKVNIEFWSHYGAVDSCIFIEKKFFKSTLVFVLSNYDYKDRKKLDNLRKIVLNFVCKPMSENSFLTLHQLSLNSVFAIPLGFITMIASVFSKRSVVSRACQFMEAVIHSGKRSLSDWIYNDLPSRQLNSEIWRVVLSGVDFLEHRVSGSETIS